MPAITVTLSAAGDDTISEATIRDHQVVIDRPEAKGGRDAGPMGGELLLAALGGCFTSNLLAAARERDTALGAVSVSVEGELVSGPARFESITMQVSSDTCPAEEFAHLVLISERGCIVANTLRRDIELAVNAASTAGV